MTVKLPCQSRPDLFHAPDGERHQSSDYYRRIFKATTLCGACPIQAQCRQLGRELHETGIWGGETDDERTAAGYPPKETPRTVTEANCGTAAGARRHRRRSERVCWSCLEAETQAGRRRRFDKQSRKTA